MSETSTSTAATMATNLRAAADLLTSVDLPRPPYITTSTVTGEVDLDWYLMHDGDHAGQKSDAAAIIRAIGGKWDKGEGSGNDMTWSQSRDGLKFYVAVTREAVCERIVTGTKTVTMPAVEAQPERTETVETVEWRCLPLLADAAVSS